MSTEYFNVQGVRLLAGPGDLGIPRARALADAVSKHEDFDLVSCHVREKDGAATAEFLIIDVRCDAVPPSNTQGIQYSERLALAVGPDPKQLVVVHALRKNFPRLMHQNITADGAPANLCLYLEPPRAVQRSWTPQNFLGRIQTWLAKAARDELHAADQPAEQLFFVTDFELVLPWNFEQLRSSTNVAFQVSEGPTRSTSGRTYFLVPVSKGSRPERTFAPILVRLPPMVHGRVDIDPQNLGGLADILEARGVDLRQHIAAAIQEQVGSGVPRSADSNFSVLLVEMPVCRTEGGDVDKVFRRAYLILKGALQLGVDCGGVMEQGGSYYREQTTGLLAASPGTTWRAVEITAMEVQFGLDRASARFQSGLKDAGPSGVFVGAGALGSAVLDLWTRCGWGQWTVIDHDHVKPHNLVRHVARGQHVGASKASVMAELYPTVLDSDGAITALHADACDEENVEVRKATTRASLVVDASTTLEYPRLASTWEDAGRHASIFVTPDANGSVLLIEDAKRARKLRTLEAQYYRALITQEWGSGHLDQHLGKYYSGASCRDISFVMPYSRLQAHAAMLSEQLQLASLDVEAAIRVWHRDPVLGTVVLHETSVFDEIALDLDDLTLFIDGGLTAKLRAMRAAGLPSETGGILLGYYDFNVKAVVVVDALPAPQDSRSSRTTFQRGIAGLLEAVAEASKRTANIVRYIGEWHSHPPGHGTNPSPDDFFQLVYLAAGMAHEGLPALQLIVGDSELTVASSRTA